MTQLEVRPPDAARADQASNVHVRCDASPLGGWSVCLTSRPTGIAVQARSDVRRRILIGEPATRGRHPSAVDQLRNAAAKLLDARCSVAESVDVLCRVMARQLGGDQLPGPSLTLLDLDETGRADIACRVAPPVLFVGATAPMESARCTGSGGIEAETLQAEPDDFLVALSAGSIRTLAADRLSRIPTLVQTAPTPCRLRDELLRSGSVDGRRGDRLAPPMAILTWRPPRSGR
jgi:hypothetical protein